MFHLGIDGSAKDPVLLPLNGFLALQGLRDYVYRLQVARQIGLDDRLLLNCGRLAGMVPQFQLTRGPVMKDLPRLTRFVLEVIQGWEHAKAS